MDDLKTLAAEALSTLRGEKMTALSALKGLDAPSTEQMDEALALADDIRAIDAEVKARSDKAAAFAGLKDEFSEQPAEEEGEEEVEEEQPEAPQAPAQQAPAAPKADVQVEVEQQAPEAPAQQAGGNVQRLAAKTKRPEAPAAVRPSPITITAAADVPEFSTGQQMGGLEDVAKAVINRARGFAPPSGDGKSESLQQFGTAMLRLDFPDDLVVDDPHEAQRVFHHAGDETRLEGGSLTAAAANGWCSPSETVYDLTQNATTEGMVSLPEVAVRRGGIRFAQSPDFSVFYANPGFKMTEAQAIAGYTKPCVSVPCPDFTDVRLDAVGLCIKVPILTNAAYPEVVSNFIAGTLVAHQHWVNADIIGRLVTASGTARDLTPTGLGAVSTDTMEALSLVIDQERERYRLSLNATVEVIVPHWVKSVIRLDLARRADRDGATISDQEIAESFPNSNVQFVYDWQNLPTADNVGTTGVNELNTYPATFQALVYPAGTFVKGTAPVINLNTVYDAASLAVNTYTGLFVEQGLLVAQMKFRSQLLTIPTCHAGRAGALNLTCS